MNEAITKLKSTIRGKKPVLIPVGKPNRKIKFKLALEHALKPNSTKNDNNWVVIHDKEISSHEIKMELIKIGKHLDSVIQKHGNHYLGDTVKKDDDDIWDCQP